MVGWCKVFAVELLDLRYFFLLQVYSLFSFARWYALFGTAFVALQFAVSKCWPGECIVQSRHSSAAAFLPGEGADGALSCLSTQCTAAEADRCDWWCCPWDCPGRKQSDNQRHSKIQRQNESCWLGNPSLTAACIITAAFLLNLVAHFHCV